MGPEFEGLAPHHICFAVDDLERAATIMARGLGAGPFFEMPHRPFDELVLVGGSPCSWDHEHAFGWLGTQMIELTRTSEATPPPLADFFDRRPVNHVAYLAPDLHAASARLVAAGGRAVLRGRSGPVQMIYHEIPGLGGVELLQQADAHRRLAAALAAHADGWGGAHPYRVGSPF